MPVLLFMLVCCALLRPALGQAPLPRAGSTPPAPIIGGSLAGGSTSRRAETRPQVVPTPPTLGSSQTQGAASGPPGLLSRAIASPPVPAAYKRLTTEVAACAVPPKIDGTIDDAAWKTATHAAGFFPLGTGTPIAPADQTEAWVCADKTHLYVAFHCLDSQPNKIHAAATQRDASLDSDDLVGIDIDSQNTRHAFSTFLVNPRGTQNESLEGGTASNITWAGDWKGAARRVPDGWTAEMSIPFALLRYPKGTKMFGLDFFRSLARNGTTQNWPYLPPNSTGGAEEAQYMHEFSGIAPPPLRPRPVFLPYTLVTGGTGNAGRAGVDIKYPLSTTVTGVAALFPDFQTIEQDVTNINFSYTEKLLTDRRPFFAEGADFFPKNTLFYSRRVGQFDGGLKVAGKQDGTTVGILSTATRGNGAQNNAVVHLAHEYGSLSSVGLDFVNDIEKGQPSNTVGRLQGIYGWQTGSTRYYLTGNHTPSYVNGRKRDSSETLAFNMRPGKGKVRVQAGFNDIGPQFTSNLGFVPETDLRGSYVNISQQNNFDKGALQYYYIGVYTETYQHHTGGFFHNDVNPNVSLGTRDGWTYNLAYDQSRRADLDDFGLPTVFHDHSLNPSVAWGGKTLYQQGNLGDTFGRQAGKSYNFLSLSQGFYIARPFSALLNYNRLKLGGDTSTQTILTGTYRLNATQTVGGRIVNQTGVDQGGGLGTDVYFSFGQQVRSGTDVFVLFGDPNSPKTRGKFTLKIVSPF